MNHGKNDTGTGGDGRFHRQDEVPSRTDERARRERNAANLRGGAATAPDGRDKATLSGSVAGDDAAGQAANPRGVGSVDSPRASAKRGDIETGERQGGFGSEPFRDEPSPAHLGDRDQREQQLSEPGAGFGDSEREQPHPGLRDVEGMTREADLTTRDEGGSREQEDVARSGLNEQQERLGLSESKQQERREDQASPGGYGYGGGRRENRTADDRRRKDNKPGQDSRRQ